MFLGLSIYKNGNTDCRLSCVATRSVSFVSSTLRILLPRL